MERREFGYLAALAILPGCSSTVGDPSENQSDDRGPAEGAGGVPGLGEDGIENVDAFLDALRTAAEETSHTASLTQTGEEPFGDGFKALELRAQYDPSTDRLHFRRWWRLPDGGRSGRVELYTDGSRAGKRTFNGDDEPRLEPVSESTAHERYTGVRETIRKLLAALEYGPLEDASGTADARYRLPVTGLREADAPEPVVDVGSGALLVTESGLLRSVELVDFVEDLERERTSNLDFEVTNVGETSVGEPGWFEEVPETTTRVEGGGSAGGDGGGGSSETTETTATTTTIESTPAQTIEGTDYDTKVVVGPDEEFVFDPEVLRIEPGTTVRWVWESNNHNIKPEDQPAEADWDGFTELANAGTEYQYTFEVEGTYEYICQPHAAVGMVGEIVVESQ